MKLVVGLGNPEGQYANTRHNLGFAIVDKYVKDTGAGEWGMENKFKSQIIKQEDYIFAKPQTYMNKSGMAVSALVNYFKINPEDIVVIHDELDLHLGKIKVRLGGAAAGHHGVESIINALSTDKFTRIRIGIGNLRTRSGERKGQTISAEKFVLESFMKGEKAQVKHMIKQAVKVLDTLLEKGLDYAQNQFN